MWRSHPWRRGIRNATITTTSMEPLTLDLYNRQFKCRLPLIVANSFILGGGGGGGHFIVGGWGVCFNSSQSISLCMNRFRWIGWWSFRNVNVVSTHWVCRWMKCTHRWLAYADSYFCCLFLLFWLSLFIDCGTVLWLLSLWAPHEILKATCN